MSKENNNELVSAIITTYKREPKIVERAIRSIINQTYKNIEIILVNDCPEDAILAEKIAELARRYGKDNRIKYHIVDKNGGACKARNIGLKMSEGEYVAFLDDDDEWMPAKIELQLKALQENDEYAISYCNCYFYNVEKNSSRLRFEKQQPTGYIYEDLLKKNIIGSCSFPLIRKHIIDSIGGFNETMPAMQDWELYLRICKRNGAIYVDRPLVRYYRYSGERISRNPQKRIKAFELIKERYINEISRVPEALYNFYLMGANDYSIGKRTMKAYKYWLKAVFTRPLKLSNNLFFAAKILIRSVLTINRM